MLYNFLDDFLMTFTSFNFRGTFEYLENLRSRFYGHLLGDVSFTVLEQVRLDSAHFLRFFTRAPKLNAFKYRVL
jgi:hypothetical protein